MRSSTPDNLQSDACEEKKRLGQQYSFTADTFAQVVTVLQENIRTSKQLEYEELRELRRIIEQARMDMEQTRLNLERHIAQHGC